MSNLDHFRSGTVAMDAASPVLTGGYFGILVLLDGTTFSILVADVDNLAVLTTLTYPAGLYLPISVHSIDVSAGAVLVGKIKK